MEAYGIDAAEKGEVLPSHYFIQAALRAQCSLAECERPPEARWLPSKVPSKYLWYKALVRVQDLEQNNLAKITATGLLQAIIGTGLRYGCVARAPGDDPIRQLGN